MNSFNLKEIFQLAIKIEENGEKFYRQMSKKIENDDARELFDFFADQEVNHREVFAKMSEEIEEKDDNELLSEEYYQYLKAYADSVIFSERAVKEAIETISSPVEAIDFAIRREWESIAYYQEIKIFAKEKNKNIIDKIIEEERKHFTKLSNVKKMF